MSHIQHDIEIFGRYPHLSIILNIITLSITFVDEVEIGLKILALIVSIVVGILTIVGKIQEIKKNGKSK